MQKKNVTFKMVSSNDILDINQWWAKLYKKTVFSDETYGRTVPRGEKQSFSLASFMEFQYLEESHPGQAVTRPYIASFLKNTF